MDDLNAKKTPMTEQERLELAAKLDRELDEFIDSLPKRRYEDGWPEDRWEEEMEKHPFFMKKAPEPGAELHPLYEGLQKLKYDPEENDPLDLAIAYKDDGNFNFKHKNYRLAILAYTEGIKTKCDDVDVLSTLFNNRAAAHYFLKNFRSSLMDCEAALKLKSPYEKVEIRAANCCFEMKNYDKAVTFCDKILERNKEHKEVLQLRQKAVGAAKLKERDERKKQLISKKKEKEEDLLLQVILSRGVTIEGGNISLAKLEPCFPQLIHNRVYLDNNNNLIWPVVFMYPEYKIMDYIQEFNEINTFQEQLDAVFETCPEWDCDKKYTATDLNVYFETETKKIVKVCKEKTLADILKLGIFIVKGGTPSFIILVKGSPAESSFLQEYL